MQIFFVLLFLLFLAVVGNESTNNNYYKSIKSAIKNFHSYKIPINNEEFIKSSNKKSIDFGTFDFIIIGSGAAGSVLANRLSEFPDWKILLLEAGGLPSENYLNLLSLYGFSYHSKFNWGYTTTVQKNACQGMIDKKCALPQGMILGGSTSINGGLYTRGNGQDFDNWAKNCENPGWSYEEVLPYFKKSENAVFEPRDRAYHGENGYLTVNVTRGVPGFTELMIESFKDLGFKSIDYNGKEGIGVSRCQMTIKHNERQSTANTFVLPFLAKRSNFILSLNSFVTKLILLKNDRVQGVEFVKDGLKYVAKTRKEVVISAGSYNSPQILMLSGIGPRDQLENFKIPVVKHLPAVGQCFKDHPIYTGIMLRSKMPFYNNTDLRNLVNLYNQHLEPLMSAAKIFAFSNFAQQRIDDDDDDKRAIVEFVFNLLPGDAETVGKMLRFDKTHVESYRKMVNLSTDILTAIILLLPKSYGNVTLKSNNPRDKPIINPNYLEHPLDIEHIYKGVQILLELNKTKSFQENGMEILIHEAPYCENNNNNNKEKYSKNWWYCHIQHYTLSTFHPTSTNRMGKNPENSVVNHQLLVHGYENLRIVDASIFPDTLSAHTMAPTIMVGEKAADLIKNTHHYFKNEL